MHPLAEILNNSVLLVAIVANFAAQLIKFILTFAQTGEIRPHVLVEPGGMPSSHSALVAALAVGIGNTQGWDTPQLAIASVFAVIVMYDAAGIRLAAGKQAKVINQIVGEIFDPETGADIDPLKELLGHTPIQVIAGAALGMAIAWILV
jgi:uncharacterized protein